MESSNATFQNISSETSNCGNGSGNDTFENATSCWEGDQVQDYELYEPSTGIVVLLSFCYGVISVGAIFGNTLVIYMVLGSRRMRTITNFFIANLALSDVIIGMFSIPFQFQVTKKKIVRMEPTGWKRNRMVRICTFLPQFASFSNSLNSEKKKHQRPLFISIITRLHFVLFSIPNEFQTSPFKANRRKKGLLINVFHFHLGGTSTKVEFARGHVQPLPLLPGIHIPNNLRINDKIGFLIYIERERQCVHFNARGDRHGPLHGHHSPVLEKEFETGDENSHRVHLAVFRLVVRPSNDRVSRRNGSRWQQRHRSSMHPGQRLHRGFRVVSA